MPSVPTATDEKLAGRIDELGRTLTDFRVEASGKFSAIEKELQVIRKLGTWLLGGVFGLVVTLITGAATIGWAASAVVSEVRGHGQRLDKIEGRLDAMQKQLDTIISRTAPAPKPGG